MYLRWFWLLLFPIAAIWCDASCPKSVYVWPGNFGSALRARFSGSYSERDNYYDFLIRTYEACATLGHELYFDYGNLYVVPEQVDAVVMFDLPWGYEVLCEQMLARGSAKFILFAWEPPTIAPMTFGRQGPQHYFDRIYTLYDDFVDGIGYHKFYEPQPIFEIAEDCPGFAKKKFCTMLTSPKMTLHPRELYSKRRDLIDFFKSCEDGGLELWGAAGSVPNNPFYRESPVDYFSGALHKGFAPSKLECYKNYKFAICYENMRGRAGYITSEKFMFCLLVGCVPIYWGAENITDYVTPDCFIDRRNFVSDKELYRYLKGITKEDYEQYVGNARRYMRSACPRVFSKNNFVDIFISSFDSEYDRSAVFTPKELEELRRSKLVMKELGHLPKKDARRWGISTL